jgi:hypothetical protein
MIGERPADSETPVWPNSFEPTRSNAEPYLRWNPYEQDPYYPDPYAPR